MTNLFFGSGKCKPVTLCTDVRDYLPIEKRHQYQDKFSMAEAAKSWVAAGGNLPSEIAAIVGSEKLRAAHFEYPTKVWGRGTAMTDVMAFVPDGVIAVEAKANESFDSLISAWIFREETRNPRSPPYRTKVVQRYAKALSLRSEQLLDIRYQLLQRTLCAALTAHSAGKSKAWMIVQAFGTETDHGHQGNKADFSKYLALVGPAPELEGVRVRLAWASNLGSART
jgi:hypothetical protein